MTSHYHHGPHTVRYAYPISKRLSTPTIPQLTNIPQWAATSVEVYPLAVSLSKVSICVFYLRINPDSFFRMLVYFVLFVIIGFTTAVVLAQLFSCDLISKF